MKQGLKTFLNSGAVWGAIGMAFAAWIAKDEAKGVVAEAKTTAEDAGEAAGKEAAEKDNSEADARARWAYEDNTLSLREAQGHIDGLQQHLARIDGVLSVLLSTVTTRGIQPGGPSSAPLPAHTGSEATPLDGSPVLSQPVDDHGLPASDPDAGPCEPDGEAHGDASPPAPPAPDPAPEPPPKWRKPQSPWKE